MDIGIVGAGHVGLPTAAALARFGHSVVVVDSDVDRIEALAAGETPFFEPALDDLLQEETAAGRLRFSADISDVGGCEVVFLCVGTPPRASGGANLVAFERALAEVARHAWRDMTIVEKSTVPAGTAERAQQALARNNPAHSFAVVSNPEFLREGKAVEDSLHPSRILIGSDSPEGIDVMSDVYLPLIEQGSRLIVTDVKTAELAKHACNVFLALKISFINAVARMCEAAGADVVAISEIMGTDPRIGRAHLDAGLGFGGFCFPKDLAAFKHLSEGLGYEFPLLDEIVRINEEAVQSTFEKIREVLWNLEEKRVALLGLAFKPDTDDVRFAPALALAGLLLQAGAEVVGYDPRAGDNARIEVPELKIADDLYAALNGAHCVVVCTEWDEFRHVDLERAKAAMAFPIIVDGRNVFQPGASQLNGFTHVPTGRPRRP